MSLNAKKSWFVPTKNKPDYVKYMMIGSMLIGSLVCFGLGGYAYHNKKFFDTKAVKGWLIMMSTGFLLISICITYLYFCFLKKSDHETNATNKKMMSCVVMFSICIFVSMTIISVMMICHSKKMIDGIFETNHASTLITSLGIISFILSLFATYGLYIIRKSARLKLVIVG